MCIPHMRMRNKLCLVIVQGGLDVVAFWVVDKARIIAGMVVARAKKQTPRRVEAALPSDVDIDANVSVGEAICSGEIGGYKCRLGRACR